MNLFPSYVYVVILVLIPLTLVFWNRFKNQKRRRLVGYVKEIRTHPVKSAKPIRFDSIEVTKNGVKYDRQFALLNQYGTFMTLRKLPRFVNIKPTILEDKIKLEVEGMPDLYLPLHMFKEDGDHVRDVTIWNLTTEGVHVSDEANNWFSKYLDQECCKLYCFPIGGNPRHPKDKGQSDFIPDYDNNEDTTMFSDGCPVLITSDASLQHLNSTFGIEELKMDRFRPNIVVTGCAPYAEDSFGKIQIGEEILMRGLYPCQRCVAVNIIKNGELSEHDLLQYLNKNRAGPDHSKYSHKIKGGLFGFNYGVCKGGVLNVGDPVYQIIE